MGASEPTTVNPLRSGAFRPFLLAEGESSVPSGVALFAATGGRWNVIELPDEIVDMTLADQMPALVALMRAYLERYGGACPFFGRVRGFCLVGREQSFRFTPDGEFIERVDGQFRRPHAELRIGNKTLESLFS
jgi:hypothetical protein